MYIYIYIYIYMYVYIREREDEEAKRSKKKKGQREREKARKQRNVKTGRKRTRKSERGAEILSFELNLCFFLNARFHSLSSWIFFLCLIARAL